MSASNLPATFSCKRCDKTFRAAQGLRMHNVRMHRRKKAGAYKKGKHKQSVSLLEAIQVLRVKRDALTETLEVLERLNGE